ncbi:flocculation protein FLO11-like [Chelonus insularis]|uniref:flocculation protein FLO11-like n=1 Tax=Chelonus insularis TaxID=460826 RepID=UPI0015898472|nr:flocculation protein FLO11-like [Chelonus insularis]
MSSFRNYNDLITYRPKSSSTSVNISLLRNHTAAGTSSNSTGAGYRLNYSNIGSSSRSSVTSAVSKDRIITGSTSSVYRNSFLKRDHSNEDKSLYKYSNLKSNSRSRLNFGKSNCDDSVQGKSSEKSSLVDKYSYPERKSNERVSSVLNKYGNRITLGEKSREPEITTRYGLDTNRRSMLRENHENETKVEETKKEHTDHSVVSCKPLPTSETTPSRSSREPSPEINRTKASSCKVHSRISDYGRSATPTEIPTTLKFTNSSPLASSVNSATSQKTESSSGHFTSERLSSFDTKTIALNPDEKCNKTTTDEVNISELNLDVKTTEIEDKKNNKKIKDQENVKQITVTVVSRATSPSPPASSSFIRTRRADVARTIQKEITKVNKRIETKNVEVQSDRMDDTARYSRFASGTRMSPWPSYLDKFQTSGSYSRSYDSSSKTNNFGYNRRSDDRSSLSRHETTTTTATTISQSNKNIHSNLEPSDTLVSLTQNDIKTENVVDHRISPSEKENSLQKKENSISISSASSSSSPSLSLCRQFSSRSDGVTTPNESKSITRNSSMKSLKQQRQITRTSSSSSSAVTMPSGKSKSASAGSLTNQSIKIKTTPSPSSQQLHSKVASDGGTSSSISVNTKQCSSLNARGKPPVPKTSDCNSTMKTAPVTKYVNKDFRKSALNMSDAGDITRTKYHRKRTKSSQRSLSVSSQESESKDNELSSARTSSNTCKSSHIPRMSNNSPKSRSNNNLSISNLVNFQASRSNSESPPRRKNSACSTASASEKSSELSTSDSSTSENGDEMRLEKNRQRRRRRRKCSKISTSPRVERKREISLSSSRTSVFALSTDELSLMTDKSHQTYFNPHNSPSDKLTQSEEAKLMMIKTSTPSSLKSSDHEIKSNNRLNQICIKSVRFQNVNFPETGRGWRIQTQIILQKRWSRDIFTKMRSVKRQQLVLIFQMMGNIALNYVDKTLGNKRGG